MTTKVLVTPRTFGKIDPEPITMLKNEGYELVFNPFERLLTEAEMISMLENVDAIIVGLDPLNQKVLENAKKLRVISKYGVGINNINLPMASRLGIKVTNTPGTNSGAVAELALGLMLNVARQISTSDRNIRGGIWGRYTGLELRGKTLGIAGTGQIGKELAARVKGFKMRIICYDLYRDEEWAKKIGAEYLTLPELLAQSDVVSLHLPLLDSTRHLIGKEEFGMMKENAIIINTARGGIIDEEALYDLLKMQKIAGAGLDVLEEEPFTNSKLTQLENVVLTSHIGAHTRESQTAMGNMASRNLIKILNGEISEYLVNPDVI